MELKLVSDTLLLVDFGQVVDPVVNARAIALAARLSATPIQGVRDIVPAYCSVGVHFDPLLVDLAGLESRIAHLSASLADAAVAADRTPVDIPVHYGGDAGPDLETLAAHAGLTAEDVVRRHAGRLYRVYMLGFVPGFAYMGGVDPALAAPRHRVPRDRVPAGSVGVAGVQTGIYPIPTPGGWQIIGRTDVAVFDPARDPVCLLSPGDHVRFVPVDGGPGQ